MVVTEDGVGWKEVYENLQYFCSIFCKAKTALKIKSISLKMNSIKDKQN